MEPDCWTFQGQNFVQVSAYIVYDTHSLMFNFSNVKLLLSSIARHLQKHARLLAVVESLDNGKPIRESRDADVNIIVRHLYYHAGWASLMDTEFQNWTSLGFLFSIIC